MTYQEWLYARTCDDCQHGGDVHDCAGTVWIDGEAVSCTCGCDKRGGTDSHDNAKRQRQAALRQAQADVSTNNTPVIRGDHD